MTDKVCEVDEDDDQPQTELFVELRDEVEKKIAAALEMMEHASEAIESLCWSKDPFYDLKMGRVSDINIAVDILKEAWANMEMTL